MKKPVLIILTCIFIATAILYHTLTLGGSVFSSAPIPKSYTLAALPLDGRPPCRDFTIDLGTLAGMEVKTPPIELMDKREEPAKKEEIRNWLKATLPSSNGTLISTDLLGFGGLWQNRMAPLKKEEQKDLLSYLEELRQANSTQDFYVYSVIPRMLVSDHVLPDRWYQWHLMQWSVSMEKKLKGLPYNEKQYKELQEEIPLELKMKYINLYKENNHWNKALISLGLKNNFTDLVIGQDDAMVFGLPNYNRFSALEEYKRRNAPNTYKVTQGADELGAVAIAALFAQKHKYTPKVYVAYSAPDVKDMVLHFVAQSIEEIIEDKLNLLQGEQVKNLKDADFILYVHSGSEDHLGYNERAEQLKAYMKQKPVALVDLSMNFKYREVLMPTLLATGVPLTKLLSYSGWNTASNALGTALAQSTIITLQQKLLPKEELPNLYAENLKFNIARLLDDWAYQKHIRYKVRTFENLNGVEADITAPHTKLIENYIARELWIFKTMLLYANLRRHPFYETTNKSYYLDYLDYNVTLPWDRTFEIRLKIEPHFKVIEK